MRETQNITICLLLVTAGILAAMLIGSYMTLDNAAYASATQKQGDYIVSTGSRSSSTELLFVIDIAANRLNVYLTNINTWSLELLDTADLARAFRT